MGRFTRLANVFRRRGLNEEIDEELQFHIDQTIEDNLAAGMTEAEAREDALRRFGSRPGLRERTRDANLFIGLEHFLQDLRHGVRMFARNPALSAICILSIAFGTGANVAIFSMADALLLRPLPVPKPSEVLTVGSKVLRGTFYRNAASYRDYQDIREQAKTFAGLAAINYQTAAIAPRASDPPRIRFVAFVSDNFFRVLDIDLQLGRGFLPDEDGRYGRGAVAVISDAYWRASFGADPAVLHRRMRIAGRDFTIVGVTAPGYTGTEAVIRDTVYVPAGMLPRVAELRRTDALETRDVRIFTLKGRLRPGVSMSEAQAELTTIGRDLERAYPDTNTNQAIVVQKELEYRYEARPLDSALLIVLTVLSMSVLGVACANVAGLLTSRAPVRAREMALRLAIGAARPRLIRQLLTESLAIAGLGAVAGIAVGYAGIALLRQVGFPTDIVTMPSFDLDHRTLTFSLIVAGASAVLVGLGPAFQTTRVDLTSSLKSSDRSGSERTRFSLRSVLVAVQVSLSLALVTMTVFAVRVVGRELSQGPGWRITGAAKLHVDAGQAGYTRETATRFYDSVLDKIRVLPGVRSVSATSALPLYDFHFVPVLPEGQRLRRGDAPPPVWTASVDERYFETMGMTLLAGRRFTADDRSGTQPVAIVNDTLAAHFWPDGPAIGKRIQVVEPEGGLVEIIGIVKTSVHGFPGEMPQNGIYFPFRQRLQQHMTFVAATDNDASSLVKPMEDVVRRLDPDVPIFDGQTMEGFFNARIVGFGTVMLKLAFAMGTMGVTLTMIGLYGLVSYSVNRRTREIGIRIAVGATYARIMRMVLAQGMTPVVFGLVGGLFMSIVTWNLMSRLVPFAYTVTPAMYAIVVPLLVGLTLFSAFLPARRAARVNPTEALRCE